MNVLACVAGVCGKTLKEFMNVYSHTYIHMCMGCKNAMRCNEYVQCVCVFVCVCVACVI